MKKIFALAALAVAAISAPAMANPTFVGPRAALTAGADDVTKIKDTTDITYGAEVGLDAPLFNSKHLTIGVEATADNVFEDKSRDYGFGARLGYIVSKRALVYAKAGYADYHNLQGVRVGGGIEYAVTDHLFTTIEYRYSDLESNAGRHQGLVGAGVRF